MATDYTVGDRDYWVDKAKKRGWAIHKLITDNEKLEDRVKELEAQLKATQRVRD